MPAWSGVLAAVGEATSHVNQTTLYLTPLHGRTDVLKRLISNIGEALQHVKKAADQFKNLDLLGLYEAPPVPVARNLDIELEAPHIPSLSESDPTKLGQLGAAAGFIQRELLGIGIAEAGSRSVLLEVGKPGLFGEEVLVRAIQVFEGMHARHAQSLFEPWVLTPRWRRLACTPSGQLLSQGLRKRGLCPQKHGWLAASAELC